MSVAFAVVCVARLDDVIQYDMKHIISTFVYVNNLNMSICHGLRPCNITTAIFVHPTACVDQGSISQ